MTMTEAPGKLEKRKTGWEFYESLGNPRYVVAPMVDASELAWRMLGNRHGAQLCFTPMYHAGCFVRDGKYRVEALQTCPEDRPLIVQFCANDPEVFVQAIHQTLEHLPNVDAIDLNLGCPQVIAKRGHFGSYLQDEWELLSKMVKAATAASVKPITVKLRVFPDMDKTIRYARMLEEAGASMITVHGRTREQKGPLTGLASWEHIKAVKEAVNVPVIANGNIQNLRDVEDCIKLTGVDGVMSAEGHLTNPAIFSGANPPVWEMCIEYLDLVKIYPCPLSYVRGHLFKMLHHVLQIRTNFDLREVIAKSRSLEEFGEAVRHIQDRYTKYESGEAVWETPDDLSLFNLKHPPWRCQPYVRPPPDVYLEKMRKINEEERRTREEIKLTESVQSVDVECNGTKRTNSETENTAHPVLSKKKQKKLERQARHPRKKDLPLGVSRGRENNKLCLSEGCHNPCALKCDHELCRACCKNKAYIDELDCFGHRVFIKTFREKARLRDSKKDNDELTKVNKEDKNSRDDDDVV